MAPPSLFLLFAVGLTALTAVYAADAPGAGGVAQSLRGPNPDGDEEVVDMVDEAGSTQQGKPNNSSAPLVDPPPAHLTGQACLHEAGWQNELATRLKECGIRTLGEPISAGQCMAKAQNISEECGRCLGKLISCGARCVGPCCLGRCPNKDKCIECNKSNCQKSFESCAGVTPSYWE